MKKALQLVIVAVVVVLVVSWIVKYTNTPRVDADGYQGVVLSNGVGYYGHMKNIDSKYLTLSDVYYLQQGTASLTLIKFGTEPQGPKDAMYINREEVMYWYNLDPKGELYNKIMQLKDIASSANVPATKAKK